MRARLSRLDVGEAAPVGIVGTAQDLAAIQGALITGVLALNGGTACAPVTATLFDAPDADGFIGVVPFPGSLITAKGIIEGTITVTRESQVWSPLILTFVAPVDPHV